MNKKGNPSIAELGKSTRFPKNNPRLGGRPTKLKTELKRIEQSGGWLTLNINDIEFLSSDRIRIKLPHNYALAVKLWQYACSGRPDSVRAMELILREMNSNKKEEGSEDEQYDDAFEVLFQSEKDNK